jgi:hypothetical protein
MTQNLVCYSYPRTFGDEPFAENRGADIRSPTFGDKFAEKREAERAS